MPAIDIFDAVSPGQVAVGVFLLLGVWGFVWGVVRQLAGMLVLALGCGVGWFVFTRGKEFIWMQELDDRYLFWISVIAAITVFFFLRVVVHWVFGFGSLFSFVSRIFGKSQGKGLIGAVVSILPAAFLIVVVALVFRLAGVIEGLEETRAAVFAPEGSFPREQSFFQGASAWVANGPWKEWLEQHDPLDIGALEKLGKILLVSHDRAALRALEKDPVCRQVLVDPRVRNMIRNIGAELGKPAAGSLLPVSLEDMLVIVRDPAHKALLGEIDVDRLVREALYEPSRELEGAERRSFQASYR